MYVITNLIICYDTQKCHTIVLDCEWIILSYETFVYVMNFNLKFYNLVCYRIPWKIFFLFL